MNCLAIGPRFRCVLQIVFGINLAWQFTAYEEVKNGNLKSAGRLSFGLNYSFGKKEKE
jgi:hypothetical protein